MRNLALCGMRGTHRATVRPSNQFVPVTRPLSFTGEREQCSILFEGGDASAWPPFCWIVAYKDRVENRNTETMGRLVTRRVRPTRPPGRSGPLDRTAGGIGGAAPASLDSYGQSRTRLYGDSLEADHSTCGLTILREMCVPLNLQDTFAIRKLIWPREYLTSDKGRGMGAL